MRAWLAAGQRAVQEFRADFVQDRAAALTYYGVLAIFPALLVLVSLLGLIGRSHTQPLVSNLASAAPGAVRTTILNAVTHLQDSHSAAGAAAMLAILYWAAPNARQGFRWLSPGSVVATAVWLVASCLFALYVANFGHYNKVYGGIATIIIFLIWLWISNCAVLFGAEFNAELQRGEAIAAGLPPGTEPFADLRDTRKLRRKRGRKAAG